MSELISGKDAYNLIGQGVEVQAHVEYEKGLLEWQDAKELPACDILNGRFDFRLKPRTITINGVELNQCYSVAIDYTELKVSVVLRNKEDTCVLYNLLANPYSSK